MTRITMEKYAELLRISENSTGETVSSLVRKHLMQEPVRVFYHDNSLDLMMEELSAIRREIRKIGVNINQMAKLFNTYPDLKSRVFHAKLGYQKFLTLDKHIAVLLGKVDQLCKHWLSA